MPAGRLGTIQMDQTPLISRWPVDHYDGFIASVYVKIGLIYTTSQGPCCNYPSMTPAVLLGEQTSVSLHCHWQALQLRWNAAETMRVRAHINEEKGCVLRVLKSSNLQTTGSWSISVWLDRWLLISMVTCCSALRCQEVMVSAVV